VWPDVWGLPPGPSGSVLPSKGKEVIALAAASGEPLLKIYNKEPGKRGKRSRRTSSSNPFLSVRTRPYDRSQSSRHALTGPEWTSLTLLSALTTVCTDFRSLTSQTTTTTSTKFVIKHQTRSQKKIFTVSVTKGQLLWSSNTSENMTVLSNNNEESVQEHVSIENLRIIYSSCFT
jgi:hypothetical protein